MELQLPKGMRDFSPEEKILRDKILSDLIETFELYGYAPLETPIVERYEVLSAKFAAGESSDAMKETFQLTDQGKRKLGLRFDLTVPFARFVAMNPTLKFPFKRYQIGEVFRDGPIKLGRYREFWQCDVDIAGAPDMMADAELIKLALDAFSKLKMDIYLKVNNRKLLISLLNYCKVPEKQVEEVVIIIDKLAKIGETEVKKELKKILNKTQIEELIGIFKIDGTPKQIFEKLEKLNLNKQGKQGLEELKDVFYYFTPAQLENIQLDLSLARGLGYYTGTIFEGFQKSSEVTSSVCGGGRYDNMIGDYMQSKNKITAVGISFGLDVIAEAMKLSGYEIQKTKTKVLIIPIRTRKSSAKIADKLRKAGINTDIDIVGKNPTKNLDFANKMGIPYVLFAGETEVKRNKYKLKNMKSGVESSLDLNEIIKKLK